MPDRYDPKLSVRPPGERKAAETPADGDPLAELARMVSGRPPADVSGADSRSSEADVERDLEAELLNDLQASFAALSGPLDTQDAPEPPLAVSASPEPDEDEDRDEDELEENEGEPEADAPRSTAVAPLPPSPFDMGAAPGAPVRAEAAPSAVSRREPARPEPSRPEPSRAAQPARKQPDPFSFDIDQTFDEAEAAAARVVRAEQARRVEPREPRPYSPPLRGPASAAARKPDSPAQSDPADRPSPQRPAAGEARGQPPAPARPEPPAPRAARPPMPPIAERPSGRRPSPGPQVRGERPNIPVRPLPMDEDDFEQDAPPPPRVAPAARPPRAEPPAAALPSRFAPQRAAAPPPKAPPPLRRPAQPEPEVDTLDEDFEFDLADVHADAEGPFEDEFTLDDLDMGAYDSDDEFPPFPEEEVRGRRRSGRVVAVVAVMLAVVAVGGAAVFLYRADAGSDGPPPIIAAEQGPTKVPPDTTGTSTDGDAQNKLIYDRVDGSADGSDTRLVTGEAEIGSIPSDDGVDSDNPISRVIIPGGPGIDQPTAPGLDSVIADAGVPEAPEDGQSEIGPRMVRTVVVKPDGTIVSSEATGVDENGNALPGAADGAVPDAQSLLPEVPRSEMDNVLDGGDLAVNEDPLSSAPPAPPASAAADEPLPGTATPDLPELPSPQPEPPAAAAEPAPAPAAPAPAPQPPRQETQVAARSNGPIDLTPGSAPAAGQAPAAGGVLVQVAAQRSEEAASSSYRDLQRRFPSILGAFQPQIVRVDLGEKGVYYRVRVGPFAGNDATRLCNDLKAAGGDCLLAR